jgi:hypothetical protein
MSWLPLTPCLRFSIGRSDEIGSPRRPSCARLPVAERLRCGILGIGRRKFHRSLGPTALEVSETQGFRASRLSFRLAQLLPLEVASINVFRAALVSVVLTLATGPNAGLLCTAWCVDATSTGCPHQDSTTSPRLRSV